MAVNVTIEAKDEREATAIRTGLADPEARALVVVVGALMQIDGVRRRERVFHAALDLLAAAEESS